MTQNEDLATNNCPYIHDAFQALSAWWFAKDRCRKRRDQATDDRSKTLTAKVSGFIAGGKITIGIMSPSHGSKTLIEISGDNQTGHSA